MGNRIFGGAGYLHFGDSSHWLKPFGALRDLAAKEGFEFVTEDMVSLDKASALIMMDIPATPHDIISIRRAHPHLKIILQTIESAVGRLWTLDPRNHGFFDTVIIYNDHLRGQEKYFIYKIPAAIDGWTGPIREDPWETRRLATFVAAKHPAPPIFPRHTGLGMMRLGWRFGFTTWKNYITAGGSLYGERIAVADALATAAPDSFDIFGPGWDKDSTPAILNCARGSAAGSKLDFLGGYRFNIAFENCRNRSGYISEKIFDPILAGTVPVYLGNEDILSFIPKNVFVDARDFKSYSSLALYLKEMPKSTWESMRRAGADWLRTDAIPLFGAEQNLRATLAAVCYALGLSEGAAAGGSLEPAEHVAGAGDNRQ